MGSLKPRRICALTFVFVCNSNSYKKNELSVMKEKKVDTHFPHLDFTIREETKRTRNIMLETTFEALILSLENCGQNFVAEI